MKGYIYIAGNGADPALRDDLNDPIFSRKPTLGACMPNIRRFVERGDWIFVVSGSTPVVQQYVVGGLRVSEKIDVLAARARFPENRLHMTDDGKLRGNIICDENGRQHPLDTHAEDSFEKRVQNYIIGGRHIVMREAGEVERSRQQTLNRLADIFQKPGANRVIDVMGRMKKLDRDQVTAMLEWLEGIKAEVR